MAKSYEISAEKAVDKYVDVSQSNNNNRHGVIKSCSGWKLSRQLPMMKKFIKEDGQANGYLNVEIKFVGGHSSVFFEYSQQNEEISKTDLSRMTLDDMHALLISKGFQRRVVREEEKEVL